MINRIVTINHRKEIITGIFTWPSHWQDDTALEHIRKISPNSARIKLGPFTTVHPHVKLIDP